MTKKVYWFLANKGGTGKTTISVSTAYGLYKRGYKVGILDADISSPTVHRLLNIENMKISATMKVVLPVTHPIYKNIQIVSVATHPFIVGNNPVVWRGERHRDFISQSINDVEWGDIDYLIVDFPAGLGDPVLAIKKYYKTIDGVILISIPSKSSIKSCEKAVIMCKKLQVPILGLVSNMSYFICNHGERHYVFGNGNVQHLAQQYSLPFIGEIPFIPELHHPSQTHTLMDNNVIDNIVSRIIENKTDFLSKLKSLIG